MALFPLVAMGLLNHHYRAPLLALHGYGFWIADAMNFVVAPTLLWWLVMRPARIGLADCGLASWRLPSVQDRWATELFLTMLLLAWSVPVFVLAGPAITDYGEAALSYQAQIPLTSPGKWLVPLYFALSASIVEELGYRALPWLYVERRVAPQHRACIYVWTTSIVFALAHSEQGPGGIVACFWFGWLAARMYARHRTLWPMLLAHFTLDIVAFWP